MRINSKLVIGVIIVTICILAIVLGIVLGIRGNNKCETADAPTHLRFQQNDDYRIKVSWEDQEKSEDCEIMYLFQYTLDEDNLQGDEKNITNLSYTVDALGPCTLLSVRIWAIGESGELSEKYLVGDYTASPNEVTPPTNLDFEIVNQDLIISWETPENLSKCKYLTYVINIDTDKELIESVTDDSNSYSIKYDAFCLKADVKIATAYEEKISEFTESSYTESGDILNIRILERVEDSDELTVTWSNHPKEEVCSLSYSFYHRVNGVDTQFTPESEDEPEGRFHYEFCEIAYIVFIIHSNDGETQEVMVELTQYPNNEDMGTLSDLNMELDRDENKRILSWTAKEIGQCAVTYTVEFLTDLSDDMREFGTTNLTYEVPEDIYCHELGVSVYAVTNEDSEDRAIGEADTIVKQVYDILPVDGLTYFIDSGITFIRWDAHPKQQSCSLEYSIRMSYGDNPGIQFEIPDTITMTFTELELCVPIQFSVAAVNTDNPHWVSTTITMDMTQWPDKLDSVQNIEVNTVSGERIMTWDSVSGPGNCTDIEYKIDFIAVDESVVTRYALENSYPIPEDVTYCSLLSIQITSMIGESAGNPTQYDIDDSC